jgi:C1A family cysteine protease
LTIEELQTLHSFNGKTGALKSPKDIRDYKMTLTETDITIPKIFEGTPPYKIKDQGHIGSCVAHGISETLEHLGQLETGKYQELSTGFIYGNKEDQNSAGMVIRDALKFVNQTGDVLESDFPYNLEIPDIFTKLNEYNISALDAKADEHKAITYFQLSSDDDMKRAIMKYGYVVIGMQWNNDNSIDYEMINDSNGNTIDYTATLVKGTDFSGYHCVILFGWNDDLGCWHMANSWSEDWGRKGCIRFPYSYGIDEAWGVEGKTLEHHIYNPVDPTPTPIIKKSSDNPIYQLIAKFVNWIINLFKKNN